MTQINLYSSGTIECYEDVSMSLNYNIADIRNPDKRDSSYSKTITIPGTKNNNKIFQHYFEVDIYGGFNPNVKAQCSLTVDTLPILEGHMQLLKINKDGKEGIEYEIALFGQYTNIFALLGTHELTELDFSAYDHTFGYAAITNSWTSPIGYGYVYPLIDYGFMPMTNIWKATHFSPALYLKEYIDKIFSYAGFTYTSDFFTSNFFRRLIIPFNSDHWKLTDSEIQSRKYRVAQTANVSFNTLSYIPNGWRLPFDNDSTNGNYDNGNNYTPTGTATTGYEFVAPAIGSYSFTLSQQFHAKYSIVSAGNVVQFNNMHVFIEIMKIDAATLQETILGSNTATVFTGGTLVNDQLSNTVILSATSTNVVLAAGDKVYMRMRTINALFYNQTDNNFTTADYANIVTRSTSNSFAFNDVYQSQYIEGQPTAMNQAIPEKVKMADLLTSTIKAFNLFVDVDAANPKNLIIEPRDDFYSSGTTVDWTHKVDLSKITEVIPMGALDAREYLFTHDEDSDYWNKDYSNKFKENYGERLIKVNNEFLVDRKEIRTIFAPTPLVQMGNSDIVIPQIIEKAGVQSTAARKSKIRLLYWDGLNSSPFSNWILQYGAGLSEVQASVPYAGHLDDPFNPTLDLNFGIPRQVYYKGTTNTGDVNYTNNNLFNKYWKKYIDEITNIDSKIVVMWLHLTIKDIMSFSFRDKYFIDGHLFRLNKIIDFDPTATGPFKCEFINIKDGSVFSPTSSPLSGGGDTTLGDGHSEPMPTDNALMAASGNTYPGKGATVMGYGNNVAADSWNINIVGDNNAVHSNCNNISMFNSSGCIVEGGLSQVFMFNSSGVTVTESNVTYFGNTKKYNSEFQGAAPQLLYASGTITSGQLLAGLPVLVIGRQGQGKYIQPATTMMRTNYVTAYVGNSDFHLAYGTSYANSFRQFDSALATATSNKMSIGEDPFVTDISAVENTDIYFVQEAGWTGGTSTISYFITYMVISF